MHAWEQRWVKRVFRLRPTTAEVLVEGWDMYHDRARKIIGKAKENAIEPFLVHRMLQNYFKEAWAECARRDRDGGNRIETL